MMAPQIVIENRVQPTFELEQFNNMISLKFPGDLFFCAKPNVGSIKNVLVSVNVSLRIVQYA